MGQLTEKQYEFLKGYRPVNRMITSEDEVDLISETLNLCELSFDERNQVRNKVVRFYTELSELYIEYDEYGQYKQRLNEFWNVISAMQSVTSVIDYYKYQD